MNFLKKQPRVYLAPAAVAVPLISADTPSGANFQQVASRAGPFARRRLETCRFLLADQARYISKSLISRTDGPAESSFGGFPSSIRQL